MLQFGIGTLLAVLISFTAWSLRLLSRSGMVAAIVMGSLVFGLGGPAWACLLIVFFLSSSLISRISLTKKSSLHAQYAKGSQRDAWQVIANGGVATLILVATYLIRETTGCSNNCFSANGWGFLVFAGSLAAANADTWATELGIFSKTRPRLVTSGRKVPYGSSGAVSLTGSLAALAGSALIAGLAALPWSGIPHPLSRLPLILLVTIAGITGSFIDSLLGAKVQVVYYCPVCRKETEKFPLHNCGTPTQKIRGQSWVDNDLVNLGCTLGGAILVWVVYLLT